MELSVDLFDARSLEAFLSEIEVLDDTISVEADRAAFDAAVEVATLAHDESSGLIHFGDPEMQGTKDRHTPGRLARSTHVLESSPNGSGRYTVVVDAATYNRGYHYAAVEAARGASHDLQAKLEEALRGSGLRTEGMRGFLD